MGFILTTRVWRFFSQIKKIVSTIQSLCQLEKFEGFFLLPWTSTLYVWLIHPYELLTLHMYDPVSEGTKSFKCNKVVHRLKYSLFPPILSLKSFPFLYHFTVGRGFPSAEQSSFTVFPTGTWRRLRLILFCGTVNLGAAVKRRTATAFERWTSRQLPGSHPLLTHFKLESKHYFILSVHSTELLMMVQSFITCGAKLLNADLLRQRVFFS